jgi:O-antigen/teichoic acid export membrane protein
MSTGMRVARNTSYLLLAFVGQKLLSFVYFTLVARLVGLEGSGKYFLATAFTTIFSVGVDLGLSNVITREVAKRPQDARRLVNAAFALKIGMSLLAAGAAMLASWALGYPLDVRVMIAVATGVMVLDGVHLALYATLRGHQDLRFEAVGVVTGQAVTFAAGLGFAAMGKPLVFLVVALACGSAWNVLWSYWCVRRRLGFAVRPAWDTASMRLLWQLAAPFALAGIFSRVYSYLDSVLLSKLADVTAVGLYGVAYKVAFAFQFLPMSFAAAVYPSLAATYHAGNRKSLSETYGASIGYLFMLAAPLACGIGFLAEPLLHVVYGPSFAGAAAPLSILMASLVFAFLYWPAGSLLNACDRQSTNTAIMGGTMAVNALANLVLIPRLGVVGAAWSAVIGNAVLCLSAMLAASRVVDVHWAPVVSRIAKAGVAAVAMGYAARASLAYVPLPVAVALAALIYAALVFASGAMTVGELRQAVTALRIRRAGKGDAGQASGAVGV